MLQQYPSRSGPVSARYREKQLHSAFDPEREAERYIAHELPDVPSTVIVIGPALGYAITAVRRRRPDCRVIALYLNSECHAHSTARAARCWHPGAGVAVESFLADALEETDTVSIAVIEWPPAVQCFADTAATVRTAVSELIRRLQASLLTEGANGRRWLSNLVRNYLAVSNPVLPSLRPGRPVSACVIAASGPSLEQGLEAVAGCRDRLILWTLGSALEAVLARGLEPDLVISTDAALYAAEYVRASLAGPKPCTIATPLTSARGIADRGPSWVLSQSDPAESLLFAGLASPPTLTPAHGSVAGTAVQLALALRPWPVIMAGLDFAWLDVRSHARPHLSAHYREWSSDRLRPSLTAAYAQSLALEPLDGRWRSGPSLQIYSRWFARSSSRTGARVARLLPSSAAPEIPVVTGEELASLPQVVAAPLFESVTWPSREARLRTVRRMLTEFTEALDAGRRNPEAAPDYLQLFLLRRLAVSQLLRWQRSRARKDLAGAVECALGELTALERSVS